MQKTNKSKLALKQKNTKGVKKVAEVSPKQKKQQQEKLKKAVGAGGAVEAKNGAGKKQNPKKKPQKLVEEEEPESEEEALEAESEDEQMESEAEDVEIDEEEEDDDSDQDEEDEEEAEKVQEKGEPQSAHNDNDDEENELGTGNTIFINPVPVNTKRVEIVKSFAPFGKVLSVIFHAQNYYFAKEVDSERVQALIVLDSPEAVAKALAQKTVVLQNQTIPLKKHNETKSRIISTEKNTVFVSDMNSSTNQTSLKKLFADCGEIAFISFMKKNKSRAFVCFKEPKSVSLALELNGSSVDGQPIKISPYTYKPKKKTIGKPLEKKNLQFTPKNKVGKFLKEKVFEKKPKKGGKIQNEKAADLKGVKSKVIKKAPKKKVVPKE